MAIFKSFQGDSTAFPFAVVLDDQGRKIPLSRFWQNQPAILVFLRHFGCIACRSHSQDVWANRERLEKDGAKVIFIGNGAPQKISEFRQHYSLENAPIFTDPTLRVFQLAGFNHGLLYMAKVESVKNMLKLAQQGHTNGSPFATGTGSNRQLGGIVVVQPGFKITYHYISEAIGDTPGGSELAETCEIDSR